MSALGSSANFLDEHGYCTEENVNQFLANIHRVIPYDDSSLRCYQAALTRGQGNYVKLRRLRRFLGNYPLAQGANGIALQSFVRYIEEKDDLGSGYVTKISKPNNETIGIEDPEREADVGLKFLNLLRCPTFMYIYGIYRGYMPVVNDRGKVYLPSINLPVDNPEQIYMMVESITDSTYIWKFILDEETTPQDIQGVLLQILAALRLAQDKGRFMHLDLHPGNVLVQKNHPVDILIKGKVHRFRHRAVIIDYGSASVNSPEYQSHYALPPFNEKQDDPDEIEINVNPRFREGGLYSARAVYRYYFGKPGEFYPRADIYKLLCSLGEGREDLLQRGRQAIYHELEMLFNFLFPDLGAYSENHNESIPSSQDPLGAGKNYHVYLNEIPFPEGYLETISIRYRSSLYQNPLPEKILTSKPSYIYYPGEYGSIHDISFALEAILDSSYSREKKRELLVDLLRMVDDSEIEHHIKLLEDFPAEEYYTHMFDAEDDPLPLIEIASSSAHEFDFCLIANEYIEKYFLPQLIKKINDHDLIYGVAVVIQGFRLLDMKERDPEDVLAKSVSDSQEFNQRWLNSVLGYLEEAEEFYRFDMDDFNGVNTYREHLKFLKGISFHPPRNLREEFDFSDLNPRPEKRRRKYYCQRRR